MIQLFVLQYVQTFNWYSWVIFIPHIWVPSYSGWQAIWIYKIPWKDLKRIVSAGDWHYAVTMLGSLGSLTEPPCLRPEYSPINEPSSLNSPPPSAYSTRLSLLMLSPAMPSPCREHNLLPFSGCSSLSLPSTTAEMDGQGQWCSA